MRVLIIGCGYVGLSLATRLANEGHEVFGLRRSSSWTGKELPSGIQPLVADITQPQTLARLPGPYDWVVNCVSSSFGDAETYRAVYLEGTKNLVDWLGAAPPSKFVYTSSTSVYGQNDGSVVTEESPTQPKTETARILLETERVLLDAARVRKFRAVILRVAGIYGPERGYWFKQFLTGQARLEDGGNRLLNMIHRDDVAGVIIAALERGRAGEVYNAVDDEPVTHLDFFRWFSEQLGKELPLGAEEDSPASARKRALTSKNVSNRKLKEELGYQLKYPTFRDGYVAELQRATAPPN